MPNIATPPGRSGEWNSTSALMQCLGKSGGGSFAALCHAGTMQKETHRPLPQGTRALCCKVYHGPLPLGGAAV